MKSSLQPLVVIISLMVWGASLGACHGEPREPKHSEEQPSWEGDERVFEIDRERLLEEGLSKFCDEIGQKLFISRVAGGCQPSEGGRLVVEISLPEELLEKPELLQAAGIVPTPMAEAIELIKESFPELVLEEAQEDWATFGLTEDWLASQARDHLLEAALLLKGHIARTGQKKVRVEVLGEGQLALVFRDTTDAEELDLLGKMGWKSDLGFYLVAQDQADFFSQYADLGEREGGLAEGIFYEEGAFFSALPASNTTWKGGLDGLKELAATLEPELEADERLVAEKVERQGKNYWTLILVREVAGTQALAALSSVAAKVNSHTNIPYVSMVLDPRGAEQFEAMTRRYSGRQIAIVVDGVSIASPVIRQEIQGGQLSIEMGGTKRGEIQIQVDELVEELENVRAFRLLVQVK